MRLSPRITQNRLAEPPHTDVSKQSILAFFILKELVLLLYALLRGDVSLEGLHARIQSAQGVISDPLAVVPDDQAASDSESEASNSTCAVSDVRHGPLMSSVRALCKSMVQRDIKSISYIIEAVPEITTYVHEGGWYPLHAAVLSGDFEIVKLVLSQADVDVNASYDVQSNSFIASIREVELGTCVEGTDGATALHYACMIGNLDIIKILIIHGASLESMDEKERYPIEYFDVQHQSPAVAVFRDLAEEWRRRNEFYHVYTDVDEVANLIREDKYESFKRALQREPKLAEKFTEDSFNLIHLAVVFKRRNFIQLLISINSSVVNQVDKRDDPDQHWSFRRSSLSFVAPPAVPLESIKNATPLHYACLMEDIDTLALLLKAGADWDIKDYGGRKPEELIYVSDTNVDRFKTIFVQFRDAEEEKRRKVMDEDGPDVKSLLSLELVLGEKLVGQRGPIRSVANAIRLRRFGWVDPDRPLTMLFLGSSGVGKTELAKQLALFIHGKDGLATDKGENVAKLEKENAFVRIDMSEYQQCHTVNNLIGSPKSYVGYGEGGALTRPLKENPKAIVLLDEVEKAHPDVLTLFLQIFDDGRITDSQDGVIYCKDATFIMTSNIAADEIKKKAPELRQLVTDAEEQGRPELYLDVIHKFTRSIHSKLKDALKRDEFIGRINQISVFLPLSQEEIEEVVRRELALWAKRATEKHNIAVDWNEEVVKKLSLAYDVNYGVRSVANEVQRVAVQLVADAQMKGEIRKNWRASLSTNEYGDIVMNAVEPENKS